MWFDGQAERFDDFAGLEPEVGQRIAQAILDLSACTGDDIILDVGAGTGAIGLHFAGLASRYLGLDLSRSMLEVFRRKLGSLPQHMLLVQADSDRPWPIRDHAIAVVFASRVTHHLQPQHFVHELFRVCRSGGHLLLGHLRRDPDSLPSRLQRYKRALLAEHALSTRSGGEANQQIADMCSLQGATRLPPTTAAQWARTITAGRLLAAWEGKPQLNSRTGGKMLDPRQRAAVVYRLTDWARDEFGGLDRPHEFAEAYTLQGVRLP